MLGQLVLDIRELLSISLGILMALLYHTGFGGKCPDS